MSDNDIEAVWSNDIDTNHLGEVLIKMGEALQSDTDGMGLRGAEYHEDASFEEFVEHELTIRYAKGGDTLLGDPIQYNHDVTGGGE